eukprot:scaffold304723_cov19-Tisochrysis_lutea.AAC.1
MHTRYTAAAAQVEAEKCAVIAKEVSEKQANCERDLAAAEPLVEQAEAALDTLNKKEVSLSESFQKYSLMPLSRLVVDKVVRFCGVSS